QEGPLQEVLQRLQGQLVPAKTEDVPSSSMPRVVMAALVERPAAAVAAEPAEAVVRVTAQSLNRLMSLAGESLVQARWLAPFSTALLKLKKHQDHLRGLLDAIAQALPPDRNGDELPGLVAEARRLADHCRQVLGERTGEFDDHAS